MAYFEAVSFLSGLAWGSNSALGRREARVSFAGTVQMHFSGRFLAIFQPFFVCVLRDLPDGGLLSLSPGEDLLISP